MTKKKPRVLARGWVAVLPNRKAINVWDFKFSVGEFVPLFKRVKDINKYWRHIKVKIVEDTDGR